jgi:hypothetical protein
VPAHRLQARGQRALLRLSLLAARQRWRSVPRALGFRRELRENGSLTMLKPEARGRKASFRPLCLARIRVLDLIATKMNLHFAASLVRSAAAVLLGACAFACSDTGSSATSFSGASGASYCGSYTTCSTCTPVPGCGWCFNHVRGTCAASPDECAGASSFAWTWDLIGCPSVDASVSAIDASPAE